MSVSLYQNINHRNFIKTTSTTQMLIIEVSELKGRHEKDLKLMNDTENLHLSECNSRDVGKITKLQYEI